MARFVPTASMVMTIALFAGTVRPASQQPAAPPSVRLIPELAPIVQRAPRPWSGEFVFTPGKDCRSFRYTVAVKTIATAKDTEGSTPFMASPHVSGIRHKYMGRVCFPTKSFELTLDKIQAQAERKSDADGNMRIVVGSPIEVTAEVTATVSPQMPVFEVDTTSTDPSVLTVTLKGYEYVSGSGSVRTPSGKSHVFP